jgi:hypothetical protein
MKNNSNRYGSGNSPISVVTSLSDSTLLVFLVEKLADRRLSAGYDQEAVQPGWHAIETSSLEAYVSGTTNLSYDNDAVDAGFTTSFIFSCTKASGKAYSFTWLCSLS